MTDYISRADALAEIEKSMNNLHAFFGYGQEYTRRPDAEVCENLYLRIRKYVPAANVAPVKYGKWVVDERTYAGSGLSNYLCSACGGGICARSHLENTDRLYRYCPMCGARMGKKVCGKEEEHATN